MIENQWYVVSESREIPKRRPIKIKRFSRFLTLWRNADGLLNCIDDQCCHRGASLSKGKLVGDHVECPFHGFQFGGDGQVKVIPANGRNAKVPASQKVHSYPVYERNGLVWVWYGDANQATEKPYFFEELEQMSYITFVDHWKQHYSRCIENQLDVVHLPFVHKTTIGGGNKTLVNGPVVEWEGELMTFYVDNIVDDGQTYPLKPDEIPDYKKLFHLQFHFPNIWQNCISDNIRIFAAFVPVDEENSLIYLRNYQNFVKLPLLKQLVNFIMKLTNIVILRQDKRVVETQLPKKTAYKMDEVLIMGDKPIIEYRRKRFEMQHKKTEL